MRREAGNAGACSWHNLSRSQERRVADDILALWMGFMLEIQGAAVQRERSSVRRYPVPNCRTMHEGKWLGCAALRSQLY